MIRILIVEDEFLIANLIKETLENQGYFCKCLFDGENAATEVETEVYDSAGCDAAENRWI